MTLPLPGKTHGLALTVQLRRQAGRTAVVAALALAVTDNALAHAVLVATEPADGAVLERAPAEVRLRFDEAVTPITARLLDGSGATVPLPGAPAAEGTLVRIGLPSGLPDDRYVLTFRVTSADAHPVRGATMFSVGAGAGAARTYEVPSPTPADDWPRLATRMLHDLALLVCAGGALFVVLIGRFPREPWVLVTAAAIAFATAAAGIGLQGAALLDTAAGLPGTGAWRVGLGTTQGQSAGLIALGAVAIGAGSLIGTGAWRTTLLAAGALLLAASLLLTGHAATAHPRSVAAPAIVVHVLAAAFWAGSLVALLALLHGAPRDAVVALRGFSRRAPIAVAALFAAGVVLAAISLGSVQDLPGSAYGRWILVKSSLFGGLLVLAAWNRLRLLPALEHREGMGTRSLRASIGAELVLIACAVGAAVMLSQMPPPRAAPGASRGLVAPLKAGEYSALLSVLPGRAGHNTFSISFEAEGRPFDPAEVSFELAQPAAGVAGIVRQPQRVAPGEYRWDGAELAFAGDWIVEINARVTEFDTRVFRARVPVR